MLSLHKSVRNRVHMRSKPKGIYCLEIGEWYDDAMRKKLSVEPVLHLLHSAPNSKRNVPFIHRDISTESELRFYLGQWIQVKNRRFPILYLAFHGSPRFIHLRKENGREHRFAIDDIFLMLKGKCLRRIIHFGACSALNFHGNKINKLIRESGAAAISGYKEDVDWMDSSVFEALFFNELQNHAFTTNGLGATRRAVREKARGLCNELGFSLRIKK